MKSHFHEYEKGHRKNSHGGHKEHIQIILSSVVFRKQKR